jgi:hypothetical protein
VEHGAVEHLLLLGVVVDAAGEGGLRAVADGGHARGAPAAGVARRQAHGVLGLRAAQRPHRAGELADERVVDVGAVGVPPVGAGDRDAGQVGEQVAHAPLGGVRGQPRRQPQVDLGVRGRRDLPDERPGLDPADVRRQQHARVALPGPRRRAPGAARRACR